MDSVYPGSVLGCLATSGAWARGQADSGKAGASMKETGVKLQFVHPAAGTQSEQLTLMLASGELPDKSTSHTVTITSKEA